ncbi:MAG: ComF family protein [Bacteroidota bacterium]
MSAWSRILDDFLSLFYPRLCLSCQQHLIPEQEVVCLSCEYHLPRTNYHLERENPFTERFWGRVNIEAGAALYHFSKGGRTQRLIHQLKYQGAKRVGLKLGQLYGHLLRDSPHFDQIDLIVPVPLHPRRERQRGYNQAALFAAGLSQSMQLPWSAKALRRQENTATQTAKSRLDRFENVRRAFVSADPTSLQHQHLLLVDDVLTTGATLEACAETLLKVPGTRISMATIALTTH